jgi:alpha-tubulin suppressor-like RCC1 family protein
VDGNLSFSAISAGANHTCGVTTTGAAYCWGQNTYGALGDGSLTNRAAPAAVGGGHVFRGVAAGADYSCGVTTGNQAYCWGKNSVGNLGIGVADTNRYATPSLVAGALSFSAVSIRGVYTCGLTTDGRLYCWGRELNQQTFATEPTPLAGDLTFTSLGSGGNSGSCALSNGTAYCWNLRLLQPTAVTGVPSLRSLSGNCGVTFSDVAYCWDLQLVAKKAPGQQ